MSVAARWPEWLGTAACPVLSSVRALRECVFFSSSTHSRHFFFLFLYFTFSQLCWISIHEISSPSTWLKWWICLAASTFDISRPLRIFCVRFFPLYSSIFARCSIHRGDRWLLSACEWDKHAYRRRQSEKSNRKAEKQEKKHTNIFKHKNKL